MDFLKDFGVKPVLLAAQVVNFLILLWILNKFLYGPILKVLNERRKKVEDSLKQAEEIEKRLKEIAEKEAEAILRGAKEGEKIIREASDYAVQLIEDGKKEYEKLLDKGVEDVKKLQEAQKEILMREVKDNLAGLVLVIFEKITGETVRPKQKEIIEKEVRNLS